MKEKMIYISTNILNKETDVTLVDNLWSKSSFGVPDWATELKKIQLQTSNQKTGLFYSGPGSYKSDIERECKKLKIGFKEGEF